MRAFQRVRTMASAPVPNKESVSSLASRIDLKGVTCLVRSDLNTPFAKGDGPVAISDDTRIRESLPTLRLLTDAGAKVVVCSHVGRPKGQRVDKLSTAPIAARLSELLGKAVGEGGLGATLGTDLPEARLRLRAQLSARLDER